MRQLILLVTLLACAVHAGPYTVTTWAGKGGQSGSNDGSLSEARFNKPVGLFRDKDGNFFVSEWTGNKIRKITPEGEVTTFASFGNTANKAGSSVVPPLNQPFGVCVGDDGTVYVGDFASNSVLKITSSGNVSTLAGGSNFSSPRGVDVDNEKNCVYVGDSWNHRIKKIDLSTSQVTTYAGGGATGMNAGDFVDAQGDDARFHVPCGVRLDSEGNVYVADAYTHRIRKVDADRNVTTIAGSGSNGQNEGGYKDGDASSARFNTLTKMYPVSGEIFLVSDLFNHRIRLVDNGQVSTLAGTGSQGFKDGPDSLAQFAEPRGIYADEDLDSIYVADCVNHCIRLIWRKEQTSVPSGKTIKPQTHKVFLNPARDMLSIEIFQVTGAFSIALYDMSGKLVSHTEQGADISVKITKNQITIPVKNLTSGTYLITIKSNNQELVDKVVIER